MTILDGGSRSQQDQYTGQNRELTVDDSNHELRLHDGAKRGGWRIPTLDSIVGLFQKKSDELDGLAGFKPGAKGFLVRKGPAAYVTRTISGSDEIQVDNADGQNGNLTFSLAGVIKKALTFSSAITFDRKIQAAEGIDGPTFGKHTGDSEGSHKGAVDVRGKSFQADNDAIPFAAVAGLEEALAELGTLRMPAGMIVMWSGTHDNIPSGWRLCDGGGGTPNLTDRFVLGSHADRPPHASGGTPSHNHVTTIQAGGVHRHTGAVSPMTLDFSQIPAHDHYNGVTDGNQTEVFCYGPVAAPQGTWWNVQASNPGQGVYQGKTSQTGGGQPHEHGFTMEDDGNHTHGATTTESSNMPPWYRLAYIMKL